MGGNLQKELIHENKKLDKPKLLHLDIETDSRCNMSCKMCSRPKENGAMPIEDIKRIIKEFADQGGETAKYFHRGEPFCDKRMPEILEYSKSLGIKNMLNSNASDPHNIYIDCLPFIDWISFSIDKQHQNEGGVALSLIKEAMGIVPVIQVQSAEHNDYIKERCDWLQIPYIVDEPTKRSAGDIDSEVLYGERKYCGFLDWRLIVEYNGDVVPCCLCWDYEIVVGNVYKQSLTEIFNSGIMNKLRDELKQDIFSYDICKECQSRKAYK